MRLSRHPEIDRIFGPEYDNGDDDDVHNLSWREFPEGEGPSVLTAISGRLQRRETQGIPGHGEHPPRVQSIRLRSPTEPTERPDAPLFSPHRSSGGPLYG